jgi:hypothetical protein
VGAAKRTLSWWRPVTSAIMSEASGGTREWTATDHQIAIAGNTDRIPKYQGDHLWTWIVLFRAAPGTETHMLDSENLLRVVGITCYYCGLEHSKVIAGRLCRGRDPRGEP